MNPRLRTEPDDASQDAPIRFSNSRWFSVTGGVVVGAVLLIGTVVLLYANLSNEDRAQKVQLEEHATRLTDHEARLRALELTNAHIDSNLSQIKEWLAEGRQKPPAATTAARVP